MPHEESRKRSHSKARRHRQMRCLLLLFLGLLSSTFTFLITFYVNSNFVYDIISSIFLPKSYPLRFQLTLRDNIRYYQPREFSGKQNSIRYDYYITYNEFDFRQERTLTYQTRTYSNDIEILFRFPKKTSVSALLLIFHSCRRTAYDWFHTAERQRIIGAALDLGYACLVFRATNQTTKCWSNEADIYQNKDIQMVLKGLDGFYVDYPEAALLPRYTFGVSSGGIFSSIFAINQHHRIQGQIIFISIVLPEILYTYVKANNYPPTAWIHMLRDIEFASEERINVSKQIFIEQNVSCMNFPIEPIPLSASLFHERMPSIDRELSRYIYYQFLRHRWLNNHNYLMYNPRHKLAWQAFLFPPTDKTTTATETLQNLHLNKNQISEFLNTIYGEHEISYERSFEALNWLKQLDISSKKIK